MPDKITIRTAADIAALPTTGKRYRAWDERMPGLCVRVTEQGARSWWLEYRDADGKRQMYRLGRAATGESERAALTPTEARRKARALGEDPAGDKRSRKAAQAAQAATREQTAARVLGTYLDGPYREHVLALKRDGVATRARIKAAWGELLDRDMNTLVELDIQRIRRRRLKAGILPQTINRDWIVLKSLLSRAVRDGVLNTHPLPHVELLEQPDDKRVRFLSESERERFLAALNDARTDDHVRVAALIAYWTGARRGEVFGLRWREVDFARGQITIRAHTSKGLKTRYVPLRPELHRVLQAWRGKAGDDALVVPSPRVDEQGHQRPLVTIKKAWAALCTRAALDDFHFHDLRHDFASRLVMGGADLYAVRDLLGHSTITLTERYSHLSPDHHRTAMEALG